MLYEHIKIPTRPDRDRSATIGASELGKCARLVAFSRLHGVDSEPSGYAERGHWVERWWVARLRESAIGHKVRYAGSQQRTISYGPLSATPDAIIGGDEAAADCKSKDPRIASLPKHEHVMQVRLTARIAGCKLAVLNYVDASDYSDIQEFTFPPYDDAELAAAVERAHRLLRDDPQTMPREGWIAGGKECGECRFRKECLGERVEAVKELPPSAADRLAVLVEQARASKVEADAAERSARQAQDEILQLLRSNGTRRAKGLAYIRRGRSGGKLDTEAMEADGIDLSLYRTEGSEYESVIIEKETEK